jgi:ribosomal 50S subunit-recycling heat shock protein
MRVDLVLKYLGIVKSRSMAKTLCDRQRVLVAGKAVRPSAGVEEGDRITVQLRAKTFSVELVQVPRKQLSKTTAVDYYRPVDTPSAESRLEAGEPLDQDLEVDLDDLTRPR